MKEDIVATSEAAMIRIGIRQIKNRLSEYLRKAKAGERVVITERGRPIAVITRPGGVGGAHRAYDQRAAGFLGRGEAAW